MNWKAIKKAIRLQMENRGLAFVEVLSECPTHLKITPEEAEVWVEENMTPVFPLGVKKDIDPEPWFELGNPEYSPQELLDQVGASNEPVPRHGKGFPEHIDPVDVAVKLAGAGGDGAQTIARLICTAAINEGLDSTYIPSYGPESRGGTSYADVHIARDEVLSPAVPDPHVLLVFNAPSLDKFAPTVRPGGTILYDETVIADVPDLGPDVRVIGVPFTQIAHDLGKTKVKNVVALGAVQAATNVMERGSLLAALEQAMHNNCAMLELNQNAFELGSEAVKMVA